MSVVSASVLRTDPAVTLGQDEMAVAGPLRPTTDRTLLNIVQACAIVGRCRRTLYAWMERGLVEYVQVPSGRRLIYADSLFRKPERG